MADSETTRQKITEILVKKLDVPYKSLSADTRLGEPGLGLDSIACLELLLSIEASMDFRILSEKLDGNALETIGSLTDYVVSQSDH